MGQKKVGCFGILFPLFPGHPPGGSGDGWGKVPKAVFGLGGPSHARADRRLVPGRARESG